MEVIRHDLFGGESVHHIYPFNDSHRGEILVMQCRGLDGILPARIYLFSPPACTAHEAEIYATAVARAAEIAHELNRF